MTDRINAVAREHLGSSIDDYIRPRKSSNDVYIVNVGEEKYCIKMSNTDYLGAFRSEPFIQSKVYEETSVPVPEVHTVDFSRNIVDKDFFIMDYAKGKNAEDYDGVDKSLFFEMKSAYSRLEGVQFDSFGYFQWSEGKGVEVFPRFDSWTSFLDNEVSIMTEGLKTTRFKYLSEYHKDFYEEEKSVLEEYDPEPNIVNSDYRLANILVNDGSLSAVLDWGSCFCGDLNFGIKKMEFLINNPTTEHDLLYEHTVVDNEKITKFYEVLMWMYIMSGFDSWFSNLSQNKKGEYEQKIREKYKESIEEYHDT